MRKLIAVGGLPATGKTTILRKFIEGKNLVEQEPVKLVSTMYDEKYDLQILGYYGDGYGAIGGTCFQGTDTLSMAVQPAATEFLITTESNILFEGDRLFNAKFLEAAVDLVDRGELELEIVLINADPDLVTQRHLDRKDSQTEQFLKGRETKYDNIRSSFILMGYITEMNNNNEADLKAIVNWLRVKLHDSDEVVELI